MNILGQQISFNFEIEKKAFVGPVSCGAWFNGEYYIIDATVSDIKDEDLRQENGIIRNMELFWIL